MKVLLTATSFAPQYGGPPLSVSRLGAALTEAGVQAALWAPDGSAATSPIVADVERHAPPDVLVRCPGPLEAALALFGRPDVIHDNGVWRPHNHRLAVMARQAGIPRIVSPRGMLEPWAFGYKPLKKRLAWQLYQRRDLALAAALHATAPDEADNLARFQLGVPITLAPNGVDVTEPLVRTPRRDGMRTMLFLSRIHPKKGLPLLIKAFARVKPEGWQIIIAGPDELGHTEEIRVLAAARGIADRIVFPGPRYAEEKKALFAQADLFVLPTYSENFGMAVAEALAHGIPVITTTGAPWAALVEHGCGWWVAPNEEAFTDALAAAVATGPLELAEMGSRGRALVAETLGWGRVSNILLELYRSLTAKEGASIVRILE